MRLGALIYTGLQPAARGSWINGPGRCFEIQKASYHYNPRFIFSRELVHTLYNQRIWYENKGNQMMKKDETSFGDAGGSSIEIIGVKSNHN